MCFDFLAYDACYTNSPYSPAYCPPPVYREVPGVRRWNFWNSYDAPCYPTPTYRTTYCPRPTYPACSVRPVNPYPRCPPAPIARDRVCVGTRMRCR